MISAFETSSASGRPASKVANLYRASQAHSRPLQGNIKAETAINTLNVFEGRLTRLLEEYDLVCRAKEALDLEHTKDDRLQPVTEELRDLKAVWTALSGIWSRLGQLRETLWSAVQVRAKTPRSLTTLTAASKAPTGARRHSVIHARHAEQDAAVRRL